MQSGLRGWIAGVVHAQLDGSTNYTAPAGDPGLFGPQSITWRVHANPLTLAVGGIAAVLLELAEPRVRTGVWEHSTFRNDPLGRMRRTAQATMLATYGPTAAVEARVAMVNRMHDAVTGLTPEGQPYRAMDPDLLTWVQVTAGYGFLNAYVRYAEPAMSVGDQDRYYAEGAGLGHRFGAVALPETAAAADALVDAMAPMLQPHPIVAEFLNLVEGSLPFGPMRPLLAPVLIDASIGLLPSWARLKLEIDRSPQRLARATRLMRLVARPAGAVPNGIVDQARWRVAS